MPEAEYSFKATPAVRTFGQQIAHIADTRIAVCAVAKGESKKGDAASKTNKADLIAALKASSDFCDASTARSPMRTDFPW
jgi:hypothetical protein